MKMHYSICFVLLFAATGYAQYTKVHKETCKSRNAYYSVSGSCDSYTECVEYAPLHKKCLDGMHFNPEAVWPDYPCGYPSDVPCNGRTALQPAVATSDCPHQYGLFASPKLTPVECRHYYMCVAGKAFEMECPEALAFNPESGRCDWPDQVPTCNADEFLKFKCPPEPVDEDNNPLDLVVNYKYDRDCFRFFSCHHGNARLLTCDLGFAFNPSTGRCENDEHMSCSA